MAATTHHATHHHHSIPPQVHSHEHVDVRGGWGHAGGRLQGMIEEAVQKSKYQSVRGRSGTGGLERRRTITL